MPDTFSLAVACAAAAGIFCGGVAGGFCRWLLTCLIDNQRVATFAANMLASFVIGVVAAVPGEWQLAVGVGFAGALSTLALLARQLGEQLKLRHFSLAFGYAGATALGGLLAALTGVYAGMWWLGPAGQV